MKKFIVLALSLVALSFNSFAVSFVQTTASPFVTAAAILQATSVAPFATTSASVQSRGVAAKEQMKDELIALNDDMSSGVVKSIDEVRQPALKEFFIEVSSDENQMNEINSALQGSELEKISAAVVATLLAE